jgi:DNA-binding winged helix-turn-helix (wHTH) protein/predicted ATPase
MTYVFEDYQLDLRRYELRYAGKLVKLEPQVFNILAYLIQHRERVVSKEELLEQLWPGRHVGEATLTSRLMAARRAIGDRGREQRMIQTVHGRGYRFIAAVEERADDAPAAPAVASPLPRSAAEPSAWPRLRPSPRAMMVAREGELVHLDQHFAQALHGARQLVFIAGEAGIGKTTLVDAFVAEVAATEAVWIGWGQCIEQHGAGEAYLPLLEALGRLGRGPEGDRLVELLRQRAPSWLLHLPALVPDTVFEALQRRAGGATRERMLRELAEAVEALTAERPLVLVLEDLQWSDASTLDWLGYMARRREAARLLVLGTYRPVDPVAGVHRLRAVIQELQLHGQGVELRLPYLPETGVAAYLAQRFGAGAVPVGLARVLHQRTAGNPLFLVAVVDALVQGGRLQEGPTGWALVGDLEAVAVGVPASIRQLLEQQVEQLAPEEQMLLEAASVAGVDFTAAAVAAGVAQPVDAVEARYDALARRGQLVQAQGMVDWPDGTVTASYGFLHALYREIVYDRVPASRRVRWHRQIGARLEAGYGARAPELAVELAEHFVRGRNAERAVQYLQVAGAQAVQRSAHHEALQHLTRGLELLATLPETPARTQQELDLQIALGSVLIATKGAGAPEVEQTYARARALCAQVGETPQLFSTLRGLCRFYRSRGALATARELGEQLDRLAQRDGVPMHRLEAHDALGGTLFYLGEYADARTQLEQGIALTASTAQRELVLHHGVALGVRCLAMAAWTLWGLGYPAQALQRSQEALALAQTLAHPYSLALAQHYAACLHHHRREALAVQAQAEALIPLGSAQGFPLWVGFGTFWRGWVLAMQSRDVAGLAQMRQGLAMVDASGQTVSLPLCLVLLAEAAGHVGEVGEESHLLVEALTALEASGRGDLLAEAYRLQGDFLLRQAVPDAVRAEACFHQALAIARRQQAKSWELRTTVSLSRLWQHQGKREAARELLAPIYAWFTEGFDTADLQEARALLDELGKTHCRST